MQPTPRGCPALLTKRERQVLDCRAKGLAVKQVASDLDISIATVKSHLGRVFLKLGAGSSLEAVHKLSGI